MPPIPGLDCLRKLPHTSFGLPTRRNRNPNSDPLLTTPTPTLSNRFCRNLEFLVERGTVSDVAEVDADDRRRQAPTCGWPGQPTRTRLHGNQVAQRAVARLVAHIDAVQGELLGELCCAGRELHRQMPTCPVDRGCLAPIDGQRSDMRRLRFGEEA